MKICRYDDDRVGVVRGDQIYDASAALDRLPALRWPLPLGDPFIASLDTLRPRSSGRPPAPFRGRSQRSDC
jgi:2,4-didehydro-3-deoxy-L-rhamnonate hydrolase